MGMPQTAQRWTADMVRALPDDGKRYEVIAGELFVTPAPRLPHQAAVMALALRLHPYIATHRLGDVLPSPADIEFDPETLVQPDVFVAPLVGERRPRAWTEITGLVLLRGSVGRSLRIVGSPPSSYRFPRRDTNL